MSIDAKRFEGRLDAALSYTLTLEPEEATTRITEIWDSGAWRSDPTRWLQRVNKMRDNKLWTSERAGELTLQTLIELKWEASKPHLYNAFLQWADGTEALATRVAEWVSSNADAGDADVVLRGAEEFIKRYAIPASRLVDWVLEHAVSALRSPHRLEILRVLFLQLTEVGRTNDAVLLLTLMAGLDRGLKDWPHYLPLWRVVEDSSLEPAVVRDLVSSLLRVEQSHLAFEPMRQADDYPRCAALVFEMLIAGELPARYLERGWETAFEVFVPGESDEVTSLPSLDAGLNKLRWFKGERAPWARFFADAYWNLWRDPTDERDALAVPEVRGLAGWRDDVAQGVAAALAPRLTGRTDDAALLAREILEEGAPTVQRVVAAMDCFAPMPKTTPKSEASRASDSQIEQLRLHLERFILSPWKKPIHGLDVGALLENVVSVELAALTNDDKVQLDGSKLRVDRGYPDLLLTSGATGDELLKAAFLYVAHELVHLPQGLGAKATVGRLRAAGGESNLLHLDLVADHIAALMVHASVRRWSVIELKGAIFNSLTNFPTGPFATDASRLRKSTRYASERLDLLMCQRSPTPDESDHGYWFLDFGPLGGPAFVFLSGPPLRLIGNPVELSKQETDLLLHAADGPEAASKADRVVERIAKAMPR